MVFSGRLAAAPRPDDERFQRLILVATTAFWDAYLKGDTGARAYLAGGEFAAVLGTAGTLEVKPARP